MNQYLVIALIIFILPFAAVIIDGVYKLFSKASYHRLGISYRRLQAFFKSFQKPKETPLRKDRFYGTTRASKQFLKKLNWHFHPDNLVIGLNPSVANELYEYLYSNLLQAKGSYEDLYKHGGDLLSSETIKGKCSMDELESIKSYYRENLSRS